MTKRPPLPRPTLRDRLLLVRWAALTDQQRALYLDAIGELGERYRGGHVERPLFEAYRELLATETLKTRLATPHALHRHLFGGESDPNPGPADVRSDVNRGTNDGDTLDNGA